MNKTKIISIVVTCVLISSVTRIAETSLLYALIATCVIAVVALVSWLYGKVKIIVSDRILNVLKKIGTAIVAVVAVVYLGVMAGYTGYTVVKLGDWYGVILLSVSGVVVGVLWYVCRWRRWWVRFLKTYWHEGTVRHSDWKIRETYYWTFDYGSNAQYGLLPDKCIFRGQARVWLSPANTDAEASERLTTFEKILRDKDIVADCTLDHIPGCIYADISAEINYKKMNFMRQSAFRAAFNELDSMNYTGEYYVEYHGEAGTILFACSRYGISRAVRIEPCEEYFIEPECGFHSDEAYHFIERYPDWMEGTYRLIAEEEFFTRWCKRTDYTDDDEAFEAFENSALKYFASIAYEDEKEQANSRWDIENVAIWLIANRDNEAVADSMKVLMDGRAEIAYWAARLFKDFFPNEANDAAMRICETCEIPEIVCRTQQLIEQWEERDK